MSSGNCFWSHCCAVFTELIVGFLIFFLSARLCSVHLFVPGFSVLFFFSSALSDMFFAIDFPSAISLHLSQTFWNSVLCDQLFLFLLTALWRMACWHIGHVAPETDSSQSLNQTAVTPWQFFGACEVYITGSCHNQDITLKNNSFVFCFCGVASLPSGPTGSDYPGGFSTAEE